MHALLIANSPILLTLQITYQRIHRHNAHQTKRNNAGSLLSLSVILCTTTSVRTQSFPFRRTQTFQLVAHRISPLRKPRKTHHPNAGNRSIYLTQLLKRSSVRYIRLESSKITDKNRSAPEARVSLPEIASFIPYASIRSGHYRFRV